MKKLILFAVVACMLLCLAGCGAADTGKNNSSGTVESTTGGDNQPGFAFTYKNTEITLHAPAAPIVAALGEPVKYTEAPSCAFVGLDKTYYYGSFYLETYPKDGKDYVYGWWFADDSVATQEGIYIGSAQADVEKAYGTAGYNGSNAYVVNRNGGTLTVILKDGVVSSIQYATAQS